jgi:hypothetical protein
VGFLLSRLVPPFVFMSTLLIFFNLLAWPFLRVGFFLNRWFDFALVLGHVLIFQMVSTFVVPD